MGRATRVVGNPSGLPRMLVPEDRQSNQDYRDNPQHDVFASVLLFCHRGKYSTLRRLVQVLPWCILEYPALVTGGGRVLPLVAAKLDDFADLHRLGAEV